nr:hypothetical protein Iba_chr12dCG3640 [Ipomoea batatas]
MLWYRKEYLKRISNVGGIQYEHDMFGSGWGFVVEVMVIDPSVWILNVMIRNRDQRSVSNSAAVKQLRDAIYLKVNVITNIEIVVVFNLDAGGGHYHDLARMLLQCYGTVERERIEDTKYIGEIKEMSDDDAISCFLVKEIGIGYIFRDRQSVKLVLHGLRDIGILYLLFR